MSADLLEDELTPKLEHKQLEQEVQKLDGEISEIEAAISRAKAVLLFPVGVDLIN